MSSKSRAEPRLALVTGAASGIGRATALRLAADGCRVIALDRSADALAALHADHPDVPFLDSVCDVGDTAALPGVVDALVARHGPIRVLVNNAGTWGGGPIRELDDATWQRALDVNVTAPFVLMRSLAPVLAAAGGGAVVNVASRNALRSSVNNAAYDASKAALTALTRTAAGEFASIGVRVNAVCPGVIATPADPAIEQPLFKAAYTRLIPLDRYGRADEIAAVIAFLVSDDASFVTGESILVDGGQIACQDNGRFMQIPGLRAD